MFGFECIDILIEGYFDPILQCRPTVKNDAAPGPTVTVDLVAVSDG